MTCVHTPHLCGSCRQMKPGQSMIHEYRGKLYCSKGCAAKAAWLIDNIPLPRDPA